MTKPALSPWILRRPNAPELDEALHVVDADGRVLCAVGLFLTLYIERGDRPQVRAGIKRAHADYVRRVGPRLRWMADPETGEPRLVEGDPIADIRRWPSHVWERFDVQALFHGGEQVDDADGYSFVAVSRERDEGELSYLSASVPLDSTAFATPDAFLAWVRQLCEWLGPSHGYAGLGIIAPIGGVDAASARAIYGLGRRFQGLELDFPAHHAPHLAHEHHIKGINWLTVLGDPFIAKLGGVDALRAALPQACDVLPFTGQETANAGVILRAGERPLWGDASERPMIMWGRVSDALRAIRTVNPAVIWPQELPGFDFTESAAWMTRFDRP